jgi:cytidylate kinase
MSVITISREFGSGGDEVATRICEILGYRSFSKVEITKAAEETAMPKHLAIDYSEDNHEVQTFLDRLFGRTASPAQKIAWTEDPSIATRPERSDVDDAAVLSLVKRAIKSAVRVDNMVIVGRGGQVLLKDTPGVLHIRIVAPIEDRIQRVKTQLKSQSNEYQADIETRRMAQDMIVNRDLASADYIKKFYDVDWADPLLYHAVINMGKYNVEQVAQIIAVMAQNLSTNETASAKMPSSESQ